MDKHMIRSAVKYIAEAKLKPYRITSTDQVEAICPFPHDRPKVRRSFYISMTTGLWLCHSCGRKGSLPRLYNQLAIDMDPELEAGFKNMRTDDMLPLSRKKKALDVLPMEVAFIFAGRGPTKLIRHGFTKKTLRDHLIGMDMRAERFTVPIWSRDGQLRAISGRTIYDDVQPRYLFYYAEDLDHVIVDKDLTAYVPQPHRYLWREEKAHPRSTLIITEGFKAAMWLAQLGLNSMAMMSTSLSREQKSTIASLEPNKIILALDNDTAGIVGTPTVAKELVGIAPVRVFNYPRPINGGESPDDLKPMEVEEALSQATTIIEWRSNDEVRKHVRS